MNWKLLSWIPWIAFSVVTVSAGRAHQDKTAPLGLFENHADVGTVLHPGSATYDDASQTFTVSGSGENMWFNNDAFHFAWQRVSGDVALAANIAFVGSGGNEHRKAVLIFRQSLDADSVYADLALHGSGLTSLQYRDERGALTHEIQSNVSGPSRLRIEKRGQYVYMWLAASGGDLQMAGGSTRIPLDGTFYVGIGVCSHDKDVVEKATFSKVELNTQLPASSLQPKLYSTLETITIASTDRSVVYVAPERFEAPNWTKHGANLLFNRNGRIERIPAAGGVPDTIDTGFANHCNNDHGISPDSRWLAISDQSQEDHRSLVYVVPLQGGTPRRVTQKAPSYWHGWSTDGKTVAFVGE